MKSKSATVPRRGLYVHAPETDLVRYPPALVHVASERTQVLLQGWCWQTQCALEPPNLQQLLASCYLQGVQDATVAAAQAHTEKKP